jgi:arsenite methyltransferase
MVTKIGLPTNTSDYVISNYVINLVLKSDKHLVFEEIFRILKPGGRVVVSDILARKSCPPELEASIALYVGCMAGASIVQ